MAARRLPKNSSQESRLSMGASRREAILYSKIDKLSWKAIDMLLGLLIEQVIII